MSNLSLARISMETPLERIFERVMLRKMTEEEKEILHLNMPVKPRKKTITPRARPAPKEGPHLAARTVLN